jgi:hypothetical protein
MGGLCILDARRAVVAELRGSGRPFGEHAANATAFAAMPGLVDALRAAEDYFGDLPSSDKAALLLHGRIVRALEAAGTGPDDAA